MILPKNQIKQFAQMKEAFQNADNSSDNEKQKNVNEEPVGAEILRKIDAQRQMLQKRNWNDEAGFFRACIAADAETVHASSGIGTLSEKKMHSVIKYFIEPDASKHESRVGNSIVDVKNESGVFEVQTASFNVLRKKLPSLLISNCVTVVQVDAVEHDRIIAYTSNLPHALAVALINSASYNENTKYFIAGSFRDGTRVADINPYLWSDLFLANRENVLQELAAFSQQLERWREALTAADAQVLQEMMREAAVKRKDLY